MFKRSALIITIIDLLWNSYYFLFISQIIIFLYASIISYSNFARDKGEHKFLKFYFLAMILALIAWILNSLIATIEDQSIATADINLGRKANLLSKIIAALSPTDLSNNFTLNITPLPQENLLRIGEFLPVITAYDENGNEQKFLNVVNEGLFNEMNKMLYGGINVFPLNFLISFINNNV